MGQHKHNPTAIAAKEGKLPPKPAKVSKREARRILATKVQEVMFSPLIDAYTEMRNTDFPDEKNENRS